MIYRQVISHNGCLHATTLLTAPTRIHIVVSFPIVTMKALRRSLSPFRRRRNADDLIQEIKLKEEEHMKRSMNIKPEVVETRVSTRSTSLNTANSVKNYSDPAVTRGRSLSRGGSWFQRNKTESKPMPMKQNRDFGLTNEFTGGEKRERRRHSLTSLPPSPAVTRSRSSSFDRSLPVIRQVSLTDNSVMDVTTALRQMETQISTARRQGKRVSRAKVMGALLSVVDQLEADQNKLGPQQSEGLLEVTVKSMGNMNGGHFTQVTDDDSIYSYDSSSIGTNQSQQTDDDDDYDDDEYNDFEGSTLGAYSKDDKHSRKKSTQSFPSVTNLLWGGGSKEQPVSPQNNSSTTMEHSSSYTDLFYSSVGMTPITPPEENTKDRSTKRVTFKSSNQSISPTLDMDTDSPIVRVRSFPKKSLFGFASPRRQSKQLVEPLPKAEGAKVERSKVERFNVEGSNIEGAKVERSKVERSKVERSNIEGAKVEGAKAKGARVEGAKAASVSSPNHQPRTEPQSEPQSKPQSKPRSSSLSTKTRFKATKAPENNSWFVLPDIDAADLQKALADIFLIGDDPKVADSKVPKVKMNQKPRKTASTKASSERTTTKVRKSQLPATPRRKESKDGTVMLTSKKLLDHNEPVPPGNDSVESTPSRVASSQSNSPNRIQEEIMKSFPTQQPVRKKEVEQLILPTRIVINTSKQQDYDDGFPDDEGGLLSNSMRYSHDWPQSDTMSSKPKKGTPILK